MHWPEGCLWYTCGTYMIYWGLSRASDGLTHRVHRCGARSLIYNHIGTAGCATLKAACKDCKDYFACS